MKADTLQAAYPERREAVAVLQVTERTLDGGSATVEVAPSLRVARDAREQPAAEIGWLAFAPLSGMIGSHPRSSHSA
jgi:hypothetical protein